MYAVFVHQTNISYLNGVLSAKHIYYHMLGRAGSIPSPLYSILLGVTPESFCLRVNVNEKPLNLEKTFI